MNVFVWLLCITVGQLIGWVLGKLVFYAFKEWKTEEETIMARGYYQPRRKYTKPRKYNGKCEGCGTPKKPNEVYCYVDDVNPAINYNAPYLCKECYIKKYGMK